MWEACITQHATRNTQHATRNTQHATRNTFYVSRFTLHVSRFTHEKEEYMVAISIMIEGQDGLTWPRWKRLVAEVEDLGFAGLFRSDHFTNAQPPDKDSLEMVVSLAYLADRTRRIHFGPLVAPFSFRNPALLARQAVALDDLSGGRM